MGVILVDIKTNIHTGYLISMKLKFQHWSFYMINIIIWFYNFISQWKLATWIQTKLNTQFIKWETTNLQLLSLIWISPICSTLLKTIKKDTLLCPTMQLHLKIYICNLAFCLNLSVHPDSKGIWGAAKRFYSTNTDFQFENGIFHIVYV